MTDYAWMYQTEEQEEESEMQVLLRDIFWSFLRASLYNKIWKGRGGYTQWCRVTGKRSKDRTGQKIELTKKTQNILWRTVDYLNTTEGLEQLQDIGVTEPPEHIDDLIEILSDAKTREQTKKEEFQFFLKNRERLLRFFAKM